MGRPFAALDDTIRSCESAIDRGDLETALRLVRSQIEAWLCAEDLTRNVIWGSRELDALAVRIGSIVRVQHLAAFPFALPQEAARRPLDAYLFTRTEEGGHVSVAGDFIRAAPGRTSIVVLTEQHVLPVPEPFAERFATPPERIVCLPPSSLLETTQMLLSLLAELRPDRVFVFNHHYDVAIVAAAGARVVPAQTSYVHHGDFLPALGVFMPDTAHLDLTPRAHSFCRSGLGLASIPVPLVAPDRGRRPPSNGARGRPVLATCGGPAKYDLDYRLPYHAVVAALLSRTGAVLYHIGHLRTEQLAAVRGALDDAGVDAGRWRHLAFVPSVWDAMEVLGVDLYLNSFPQRGARVAVEVMGSGTPAVWHRSGDRYGSVDLHLAYPGAASWSDVDELVAIVQGLDAQWLARQGDAARAQYENVHHPLILAALVARGRAAATEPASPPERLFAFEFDHMMQSWHRLTKLIPP